MRARARIAADTNVLISRLLAPNSSPGLAIHRIMDSELLLISEAMMYELANVLARPKFNRYVSVEDRRQFVRYIAGLAEWVTIVEPIRACRDAKDDKVLELAVNGRADLILSGDRDLLVLHPFRNIPVLAPAAYLPRE